MKSFRFVIFGVLVVVLTALACPVQAGSEKYTCYLEAVVGDIHVYVNDVDADGNTIGDMALWSGNIEKGKKVKIESSMGYIEFGYRLYPDDKTIGANNAGCQNGKTIPIP